MVKDGAGHCYDHDGEDDDDDSLCSDAPVCVSQGQAVGAAKGGELFMIF